MPRILPTAQNKPLALYVHHIIAMVVMTMPSGESIGIIMPSMPVATSGSMQ